MHYVIQENIFQEAHYAKLLQTVERFKLPHTVVRIFPFSDKIVDRSVIGDGPYELADLPEFVAPEGPVFVFGAVKLARVSAAHDWRPGSLLNANHDFNVYREHYREHLLNWDSRVQVAVEPIDWAPGQVLFIRPVLDSKTFTGAVFDETQWQEKLQGLLLNDNSFNLRTEIQVASPKKIQKEIRCWVVGGEVVAASQYKLGPVTRYDSFVDDEAIVFAEDMVRVFQLAEAFVIDVCLVDDVWKVVECGCINSAGFYHADVSALIGALENHFNPITE